MPVRGAEPVTDIPRYGAIERGAQGAGAAHQRFGGGGLGDLVPGGGALLPVRIQCGLPHRAPQQNPRPEPGRDEDAEHEEGEEPVDNRVEAVGAELPVSWLLTTTHVVMNGAAEDVRTGRIDPDDAPWFIDAILLPAFTKAGPEEGTR